MTLRRWGLTLLSIALTIFPALAAAAPPDLPSEISYQGVLLDDTGAARTGTVDLVLRIYDEATGGALAYKQEFLSVPLTDGVFSVVLGPTGEATDTPTNPLTTSLADALAGDPGPTALDRFIELTVGTETALARTQVLSVPYALRSESAATADVATTALDAGGVGGLPSTVLTEAFEHFNFDGGAPPNDDPSEGLGDTDLDGVANFVDPDNDDDSISDIDEVAQGSDINLVTPFTSTFAPSFLAAVQSRGVTISGGNFDPGQTVVFGSESPASQNLTPTSFDVVVGPQSIGFAPVTVTHPNGEVGSASFEFSADLPHGLADTADSLRISFRGPLQNVVSGVDEYRVDTAADFEPDTTFPFVSLSGEMNAVFDPTGELAGVRCRETASDRCEVEVLRDSDGDFDLLDEVSTVIEELVVPNPGIRSLSLAFDSSNRVALGYARDTNGNNPNVRVAHDRDGDGLFTGTNELVVVAGLLSPDNPTRLAVDGSDRVAVAYVDAFVATVKVAYDRSGDGDYDDTVGGNPEKFDAINFGIPVGCLGAGFAPDGDLFVVSGAGSGLEFARDLNGDGDLADASEITSLGSGLRCAGAGGPAVAIAYEQAGVGLVLRVDRNDDGDFDDVDEDVTLSTTTTSRDLSMAFATDGRAMVIRGGAAGEIFFDPTP